MDRVTVVLHAERRGTALVLDDVWYSHHHDGVQEDCLQLRQEHADEAWHRWETVLFETTSRAQLSLF